MDHVTDEPAASSAALWPQVCPMLDADLGPTIDTAGWRLEVCGAVERPAVFTLDELRRLPTLVRRREVWTARTRGVVAIEWSGLDLTVLARLAGALPEARQLITHCADAGYTTSLERAALAEGEALLAWACDGEPLSADQGGPLRSVLPARLGWKAAKAVRRIEFA